MSSTFSGDKIVPFFGFLGVATALVISCMGAAYETIKSGLGVVMIRPELVMKSIVPVVKVGVLGIYGLIIAVIISTRVNPKAKSYYLLDGYAHLSSGLTYGLAAPSTGMAIAIVGDAGVSTATLIGYYILIKYIFKCRLERLKEPPKMATKDQCMDGDFASMVELVKVDKKYGFLLVVDDHIHTVTHLNNNKSEEELKVKMPSLDEKYTMEPEEVGHELLLYNRLSSSPVEIPANNALLEPSKKGRCWNERKSRGCSSGVRGRKFNSLEMMRQRNC
ncbi:hypothetical protein Pint_21020 [Pistacia integerrima]|uniref:Uncharacterized protein n=1 Tax=Pistacia integerrima TaxID=434235 RepID=A0ACC0XE44_9ROSI|nr:hypothetical protein Pint_21020 [Pistacia integerrima]